MPPNGSCSSWPTPAAADYLRHLEPGYLAMTAFAGAIVLLTNIMFLSEAIFIYRRRDSWPQPAKCIWLLGLYTVFGWTAFVGLLVPRSGDLGSMIATMYLSSCLYVFKRLLISYYGGPDRMRKRLEGDKYILRSPPCCCCCFCLPQVAVTATSAVVVEMLVLQYAVIQPILVFVEAVIIADLQENMSSNITLALTIAGSASSMLALYGLFLFFFVSRRHLSYASVAAKFVCLKLVLGVESLQNLVLSVLADTGVLLCSSTLSNKDNAVRIGRLLLVGEAFLVSLIARVYYKRDQTLYVEHIRHYRRFESTDESQLLVPSSDEAAENHTSTLVGTSSEPNDVVTWEPDGKDSAKLPITSADEAGQKKDNYGAIQLVDGKS